jgi:SAM-dependent methyltransferase
MAFPSGTSIETMLVQTLRALAAGQRNLDTRLLAASLLQIAPVTLDRVFAPQLHALLLDPDVDPAVIEQAAWRLLRHAGRLPMPDGAPEVAAKWLESDAFARALLAETTVTIAEVERVFAALRRWLLLSGKAAAFPLSVGALEAQANRNGGAWPFDAEERAALPGSLVERTYLPPRATPVATAAFASPVTRDVAAQYEAWPYPAWRRVMAGRSESLTAMVAALGPGPHHPMPEDARILIAGCGTGHEACEWARRFPHAQIIAIDLSTASLAYAAARAAEAKIANLAFEQRDLHTAAELGRFDLVISSGVLHHLPDPEAGWAAISQALRPGGVMRLILYSRIARQHLQPIRERIRDLTGQPMTDDILRAIRARLLGANTGIEQSRDFYDLGGVHDLLAHAHEDSFDIPRIRAGIERLGLTFLGFRLPGAAHRQAYLAEHPGDPHLRDLAAWEALERREPMLFAGMYEFWCARS